MENGQNHMKYSAKSYFKNRIYLFYVIGIFLLLTSAICGLLIGSTHVNLIDMFGTTTGRNILLYVRFPRVLSTIFCGLALAVAGVIMQGVLANKLASPNIIGVNSGAGLAATICAAFGIYGGWVVSLSAFLGAFFAVMFVSICARKWNASRGTVILIGVAMNSLFGAITDSIITLIPNVSMISNDFKIGEFTSVTYTKLIPAMILIVVAFFCVLFFANDLDVLTLGDESAKSLGMNTGFMRTILFILVSILAGSAVSIAGLLSFVGLIVPHAIRKVIGNKSIHLLILSGIYGGIFVCFCDILARTIFSPYEIPVGIFMAFLGAPFFIYLLIKGKGGHRND